MPGPAKSSAQVTPTATNQVSNNKYKFVDEAAKLWSRETSRKPTASSTSSKDSTPTPDWNADLAQSGSDTPPSSTCSDELDKIDAILLAGSTLPSIEPSTYDAAEVPNLTSLNFETTHSLDSIISANEYKNGGIGRSRTNQDLENPPVASIQVVHDEPVDAELEDVRCTPMCEVTPVCEVHACM